MSDLYTSIDRLLSSGSRLDTLAGSKLSFSSDTYNSVGQVNFLVARFCFDFLVSYSTHFYRNSCIQDRNKIHRTSRAIRLEEEVEALESEVSKLTQTDELQADFFLRLRG